MSKRYVSTITVIIFMITMIPFIFVPNANAYTNNSYFNDLKVGLVSMSSTAINVTLNGDYTLNGQTYKSGTVLNLGTNGTSITLNGESQSQINLTPNSSGNLLIITSGSISNKYMGSFLIKVYNGKILPINIIDMENYLKGVVGYEMSDYFPVEALKAQAVAARNYALSRIGYEAAKGYDFDDTISYQVYKGYNASYTNVLAAVDQTKGQVLLYNDKLVETLYSAWHGGVSENSENVWGNYVPYLRSVQDPYESDPWPNGNRVLTNTQIQSTLVTKGYLTSTDTFLNLDLNSITKFASGRVSNINIVYKDSTGTVKTKSVTKDSTRTFLSLPSNLYTVVYDSTSGSYTFSGKGYGHGLGMSQIGAKNRAAAGQTYDQILKFYYQGTYLQNLILKATLNTLTQSANALYTGNTISFNSSATGGNGYGYLFKYVIKNGTDTVFTSDYTSNSSLDFVPSVSGNYTVEAYVKDKFSISDYDDKKVSNFTVYNNVLLNSFTISKTDTLVGQAVTANIDVQSGSGSYLYKYEVTKDGTILTTKDFSADKQFSFTPNQSGNYAITGYVKDSISTKPYDFKQSQSFNAYDCVTINSLTKNDENVFIGDTVDFSTVVGGGSNKGVNYKYVVIKDGEILSTRDFDSNSNFTYVPTVDGNYELDVYVLDAISSNQYDAMTKMNFVVNAKTSITSFVVDKNTSFVNDTVTFDSSSSSVDSLYKFVISKDGTTVYTQDYCTSSEFKYIPTLSGNYQIQLFVKHRLSKENYDDVRSLDFVVLDNAKINSMEANKNQYLAGQIMSINTTASLGSGNYLYKYEISKGGVILSTIDYGSVGSLQYTPNDVGTYSITVYMKDVLSSKTYDDTRIMNIPVFTQPTMSYTSSQNSFLLGSALNCIINEINGSGKAQYRFVVNNDNNILADSGYLDSNIFNYTPILPGVFQVTGYMKDSLSENDFDAQNTLRFNVFNPQITNVNVSGYFYEGKGLTFNANSTGSSSLGFDYKYEIYNNNGLVASNNFNASSTFSFTPTAAGIYTVKVYGKDGLSMNAYDSIKQFNITVNSKPLYLSILPLSYGMTNSAVASLQGALVKLGYSISDASGYFGTQTKNAVIAFQKSKGLTRDGIVGKITYGALNDTLIEKAGVKSLNY